MKKRVVVGISGGVDSALSALVLKQQGFDVIGLFMRNWVEQDACGKCTADDDLMDARLVCEKIDIPYYTVDFSKEYWDKVFKHFIAEYSLGRTPNPDVLCNKEIKFDAFLNYAFKVGCDYIATGHYANVAHTEGESFLLSAKDENKDQTYFLNQLSQKQIEKVIFPLGNMQKGEVRQMAKDNGLIVHDKKDSTGVCFIGERNFRSFLKDYIPMKEGNIVDDCGNVCGKHSGVFYYTLGQRRGLGIGGAGNGKPWFVTGKDVANNILYVKQGEDDCLFKSRLSTQGFNFISNGNGYSNVSNLPCFVRIRHRQPLQKATITMVLGNAQINFESPQRAIAPGQYAVVYVCDSRFETMLCIGGGVIV